MLVQRYGLFELTLLSVVLLAGCASLNPDAPPPPSADGASEVESAATDAEATDARAAVPMPRVLPPLEAPTTPASAESGAAPVLWAPAVADADEPSEPPGPWGRLRADFRLPEVRNDRIAAEIARYSGNQRYFDIVSERAEPYLRHILDRIEARDLPAELLMVPIVESAFRPFAYSRSHAGGMWQFKPLTGQRFGLAQNWWYDGRRDVVASTEAALDYLEYLHEFFNGDWLLAMAAYNAGEGRVRQAVRANQAQGRPTDYWHLDLPNETEKYVPRILALRAIFSAPAEYGIELPSLRPGAAIEVVDLQGQVDLALAAEMADVPLEDLYRYNAGLNRWVTPPEGPHRLALPVDRAEAFRTALAQTDAGTLVQWHRHEIESGETLSQIARVYDTSVTALRDLNDIEGHMIRAGANLLVPSSGRSGGTVGAYGARETIYRVRRGDSLWEIARAHGVGVDELARWNGLTRKTVLHPGQRLAIRGGTATAGGRGGPGDRRQQVQYTVRKGDSLYVIARRFNVRVAELRDWNSLDPETYLQPGQRLRIHVDVTNQTET